MEDFEKYDRVQSKSQIKNQQRDGLGRLIISARENEVQCPVITVGGVVPKRVLYFKDRLMADKRNGLTGYDASEGVILCSSRRRLGRSPGSCIG